jgi:hypothetical protein
MRQIKVDGIIKETGSNSQAHSALSSLLHASPQASREKMPWVHFIRPVSRQTRGVFFGNVFPVNVNNKSQKQGLPPSRYIVILCSPFQRIEQKCNIITHVWYRGTPGMGVAR